MQSTGIDLLVPGLLGPIPNLGSTEPIPQLPSLEIALSRAHVSEAIHKEYTSTLFHLFGLNQNQPCDLPTAPYCRFGDGGPTDDRYWLQLSPVHLQPDGDGLLLFDTAHLDLSLDEAQQLAALVQEHFHDLHWKLELSDPQRWYLGLKSKPDLQTSPLTDVIGRNINSFLPKGGEAMEWHAILNELQMLLHSSKVNMLREGRGQLAINGLWPHGGGSYQRIEQPRYRGVYGDDPLLCGLAQAAGLEYGALPEDSQELAVDDGRHLVVYSYLQRPVLDADLPGWIEAAEKFNRWLQPLLGSVQSKRSGELNIHPGNGRTYGLDGKLLRRFWRRKNALISFISD
jgi:hypothetical protein